MLLVSHLTFCSVLLIANKASGTFLRTDIEQIASYEDDTDENKSLDPIIAIIFNRKPFLRTYDVENSGKTFASPTPLSELTMKAVQSSSDDSDTSSDDNDSGEFSDLKLTAQQKTMLRKKWRASCDKKAAKVCKKACDTARKNVCRSYRCKKSLSKNFKKECKRSCDINFLDKKSKSDSE